MIIMQRIKNFAKNLYHEVKRVFKLKYLNQTRCTRISFTNNICIIIILLNYIFDQRWHIIRIYAYVSNSQIFL